MKPAAVILKYRTDEIEPGRSAVTATALDLATMQPVAAYSLQMMSAWLTRHGYQWNVGSSGVWIRRAA